MINYQVSESTGNIVIQNLVINSSGQPSTVIFRGITGKDETWISNLQSDTENADWLILIKLCTKWGDIEQPTLGDFLSESMPYGTLRFLRSVILSELFRLPEYSKNE